MEYKELRILTIISMILGFIVYLLLFSLIEQCGYTFECSCNGGYSYYYESQILLKFGLFYGSVLTLFTFDLYPLLYLRKKNKEQKEVIQK